MSAPALLALSDGSLYEGSGIGPPGISPGEAVFYTGMTGYEEALTDPSYAGQLLIFTYPLIGNYGVDAEVRQHATMCAAGAICKRISRHPSHYRNTGWLGDWFAQAGTRAIEGVDTRALVTRLREAGTMRAVLAVGEDAVAAAAQTLQGYLQQPLDTPQLVDGMSTHEIRRGAEAGRRVVLIDCGTKGGITRALAAAGAEVIEVPWSTSADELLRVGPKGVVISNGPGDPSQMRAVVETLKRLINHGTTPTFGICFGHQLLALALGAKTYKLKYGHRGGNQPVQHCASGQVMITAHNHGYAVDAASLPPEVEQTMINLNDGTNEGLRHRSLPLSSVQFHPEASPGPGDAHRLIDDFVAGLT